jgi:flagellar basal-body rod modification protein FlgD
MASNPVNGVFGYATPTATSSSSAQSTNGMGKDTFMKLLVAQMANQNPMEPTDDKEMIAQMTQFSTLEQITNMATESSRSATASQMSQAVNLLGRTVTYLDADGKAQTGTVDQVSMVNGAPNLTIGGNDGIVTSQITQVR